MSQSNSKEANDRKVQEEMEYEVSLMLECGHVTTIDIPDFISIPSKKTILHCFICASRLQESRRKIWLRGTPYKKTKTKDKNHA